MVPGCILFPPPIQTTGETGENLAATDSPAQQTGRDYSWAALLRDYLNIQGLERTASRIPMVQALRDER